MGDWEETGFGEKTIVAVPGAIQLGQHQLTERNHPRGFIAGHSVSY